MRLSRPVALIVAALTLAPWAYFAFFFVFAMSQFTPAASPPGQPDQLEEQFATLFRLHLLVMVFMVGLIAFYIVHLFRTDRIPADKKALWAVVLFFAHVLAMPFYWYLYMWPKADEGSPPTSA